MSIICYPKSSQKEKANRLNEMRRIGVKKLLVKGEKKISGYTILGKGCVSIVILVETNSGIAALKIRRTDANRKDMLHEVKMLSVANDFRLGPKLLAYSDNLLLLEYVDGPLLIDWLHRSKKSDLTQVKKILKMLLEQCHTLDEILLDHGELSNASKHVIIRDRDYTPAIIDFESASVTRRVKNLTSICQFLFMNKENSDILNSSLMIGMERLKNELREYKLRPSEETFLQVLATCNL